MNKYFSTTPFSTSTFLISLITFLTSISVVTYLHGTPMATVTILELRTYGGLDLKSLSEWKLWSLVTAQLVHVKQFHMLFNVASLFLLGISIERIIGRFNVFLLWLIAGSLGVIVSAYCATPPFNVGTGASQAVFGFIAAACIIFWRGHPLDSGFKYIAIVIFLLSLSLDLLSVHSPTPGHITSFVIGLFLSLFMMPKRDVIRVSNTNGSSQLQQ